MELAAVCCGSALAGRFPYRCMVRQEGAAIAEFRGFRSRRENVPAKKTASRSFDHDNIETALLSSISLFRKRLSSPCRTSTANTVRYTPGWENWLSRRLTLCGGIATRGVTC